MQLSKTRQTLKTFILALLLLIGPVVMEDHDIVGVALENDQKEQFLFFLSKPYYEIESNTAQDTTKGVVVGLYVPLLEAEALMQTSDNTKVVGLKAYEKAKMLTITGTKKDLDVLVKPDGNGFTGENIKDGMSVKTKAIGANLEFKKGGEAANEDVITVEDGVLTNFTPDKLVSTTDISLDMEVDFKLNGTDDDKKAKFSVKLLANKVAVTLNEANNDKKIEKVTLGLEGDETAAFEVKKGKVTTTTDESVKLTEGDMNLVLDKKDTTTFTFDKVQAILAKDTTPADRNNNGSADENGFPTWAIVLIVGAVVAILGGVVFFIMNSGKE